MSEPTGISYGDWLAAAVTILLAALGGIMGWIKSGKKEVHDRLVYLEKNMSEHETRLAVVQTCQENTAERLTEIKETTVDTNSKVEHLNETLTKLLVTIQTK